MEIYQTEEQQVDAIKGFWKENGSFIIAGAVLGLAAYVGFNIYKDGKLEDELARSDAYQVLIEQSDTDVEGFKQSAQKFIAENPQTSYASLTALSLAKAAATEKNWEQVAKELTIAIDTAPSEGIKAIATVRLARVQVQTEQLEQALTTLKSKLPASFTASVEEIKGDIYLKQDKKELARTAYQAALSANALSTNPVLQMKLDDLAESINLTGDVK